MQGNKYDGRTISRIFKAYKKIMQFSFLLCVGLVLGAILASPVTGDKKPMLLANEQEEGESSKITEEAHVETSGKNDPIADNVKDSSKEPTPEATPPTPIPTPNPVPVPTPILPPAPNSTFEKYRFTVLLVGVDRRPDETSLSNTDTLLVASVNTENGKIALISIPRDTQVIIPGYGKNKINAAARVGKGLNTTIALVEGLIDQPIDGYVLTNFTGFKSIIDTLGGITVNVEKDMHYVTGDVSDGVINLSKGTQRLNGTQALQYARFRHDALADISRTVRQQTVLKAMGKEFMKVKTITKLPWLIPQIQKSVETNLSLAQLWSLANIFLRFEKPEISSQTLPGNFLIENDISYWKVNPRRSRDVTKRLLEEGKTSSVFFNADVNSTIAK
ncbi:LCP family protein [Desulfosporosinus sp. OT]|uniref:LCP family protein n=1 Tax=Desulfosporosinus sp. OT TaxID=913865 RepID=UPI00030E860A|nr:LCP family protein [Desulfosporosinus sp. OT]